MFKPILAASVLFPISLCGWADAADLSVGPNCARFDSIPDSYHQTPNVDWWYYKIPRESLNEKYCHVAGQELDSCSFPIADGTWAVLVANDLTSEEMDCAVIGELSTMPPNNYKLH